MTIFGRGKESRGILLIMSTSLGQKGSVIKYWLHYSSHIRLSTVDIDKDLGKKNKFESNFSKDPLI